MANPYMLRNRKMLKSRDLKKIIFISFMCVLFFEPLGRTWFIFSSISLQSGGLDTYFWFR